MGPKDSEKLSLRGPEEHLVSMINSYTFITLDQTLPRSHLNVMVNQVHFIHGAYYCLCRVYVLRYEVQCSEQP